MFGCSCCWRTAGLKERLGKHRPCKNLKQRFWNTALKLRVESSGLLFRSWANTVWLLALYSLRSRAATTPLCFSSQRKLYGQVSRSLWSTVSTGTYSSTAFSSRALTWVEGFHAFPRIITNVGLSWMKGLSQLHHCRAGANSFDCRKTGCLIVDEINNSLTRESAR